LGSILKGSIVLFVISLLVRLHFNYGRFDSNFTGSDLVTLPVALVIIVGVGRLSLFITTKGTKGVKK
jgi:hypothetical protein